MSKRLIWILTALVAIAISILITIQFVWIKNAIEINHKQFQNIVNKSLNHLSKNIETQDIVHKFRNSYNNSFELFGFDDDLIIEIIDTSSQNLEDNSNYIEIDKDSIFQNDSSQLEANELLTESDISKNLFAQKASFINEIAMQLLYDEENRIEKLNYQTIDSLITKEFGNDGINLSYEFMVLQNNSDTVFISENFVMSSETSCYMVQLYQNSISENQIWLSIIFPHEENYIFSNTGLVGSTSIILSLVILLIFISSVYIIFRQRKLSEIKDDFINNMTHELKTPISTILLAVQMLKDKTISISQKSIENISDIIDTESKRLSFQVEKVLQTAILDEGKINLKFDKIDINSIVRKSVKSIMLHVEKRKGEINLNLDSSELISNGDDVHLTNVFSNLFDNAIKYNLKPPILSISSKITKEWIIVTVEDNGIGIRKENQKKVFDKFFRVPTGNVHDVKGFGLGLSYVKKIVDEHHGKIFMDSVINKGTKFIIYFQLNSN
ncbi:MAG: HAMP domain-containing histidine kinase [Bacteroidetes bacterium]|jgi:two-component system, OmpR family, phosphate regulon sensor histidine kinase PhoR|nr:HAMP domain-containing histidine kinase [Bacteroidota bacterium]MBT6685554.1 HAMP domain-containing histidine kinase [Bacteroidota bacterium]MBT7142264.1 HAMP domain-containing histidine kinase [Bacteroidota bacterium]MBT7490148.1 HAMP domain-containing histidine kinase [Bacteroidota bacterium]